MSPIQKQIEDDEDTALLLVSIAWELACTRSYGAAEKNLIEALEITPRGTALYMHIRRQLYITSRTNREEKLKLNSNEKTT